MLTQSFIGTVEYATVDTGPSSASMATTVRRVQIPIRRCPLAFSITIEPDRMFLLLNPNATRKQLPGGPIASEV